MTDPFIMAKQAKHVFYVQDPCDERWSVVLHGKRFNGYGFMSITVCFINICICRLQFVLTCREGGFFLSGAEIFVSVCSFIQLWSQYYSLHVCFLFFVVIFLDSTNNFVITLFI